MNGDKLYPNDLLEILKKGSATRERCSEILGCSLPTVQRLRSDLVTDGCDIGWDNEGYFLLDKKEINSTEAEKARKWTQLLYNDLIRMARHAENHKPVAILARKMIGGDLTLKERAAFKAQILLLGRTIDAVDLDEELGE